jgi:NAD(P) transhydrogenase subunit beta
MNRSIRNIIVGGFGTGDALAAVEGPVGDVRSIAADDPAIQLAYAQKVVTVPGYALAAAQAQHQVCRPRMGRLRWLRGGGLGNQ